MLIQYLSSIIIVNLLFTLKTILQIEITSKHLSCHLLARICNRGGRYFKPAMTSGSIQQWSAANKLHPAFTSARIMEHVGLGGSKLFESK